MGSRDKPGYDVSFDGWSLGAGGFAYRRSRGNEAALEQEPPMPVYPFVTVDVFTERRFGGNPLAVFTDATGMSDAQMQSLAAEMNLSETTFILPPADPAHTARVRIFNRTAEMPFAGHPSVGTGYVLAQRGQEGVLTLEVPAGVVEVRIERDAAQAPIGAVIAAPKPLSLGAQIDVETIAACAGLDPEDIVVSEHQPVEASVGVGFIIAQVSEKALAAASPNLTAFRMAAEQLAGGDDRLSLHLYSREGGRIRARMFAPLSGTWEDAATGSANAALAALLLSLTADQTGKYEVAQGMEMGRPSRLKLTAKREGGEIFATVGGGCVPVFRGEALV
jgi:trans-2,3-dihydro-3-hydroxyanthranilate isomerase